MCPIEWNESGYRRALCVALMARKDEKVRQEELPDGWPGGQAMGRARAWQLEFGQSIGNLKTDSPMDYIMRDIWADLQEDDARDIYRLRCLWDSP